MNRKKHFAWLGGLVLFLASCTPSPPPPAQWHEPVNPPGSPAAPSSALPAAAPMQEAQLPVRFQRSSYLVSETTGAQLLGQTEEKFSIQVGADISSAAGPVPLRDILRQLTRLKNMNLSWASDVDQNLLVDVGIRAEDDFFTAIDNLLRQVDYFHEMEGNTIIVKYKETRKFQIAMPFLVSVYETGVGGDVLGGARSLSDDAVKGNIKLYSQGNTFDVWDNIRLNLDQILEIWSVQPPSSSAVGAESDQPAPSFARNPQSGKGYYSIDRPVGLITVTAPRPLLEKAANYLDNLKQQLYRQVSIEAKILEVTLSEGSTKGINWTDVISSVQVDFQLFGPQGIIYSPTESNRALSQISTPSNPFSVMLDAIETHGNTKVLANPKLSVMNGQPALISVGENVRFIDQINVTRDEQGHPTYTTSTASIMDGLGLSVVATIMENDEIILSLTPVTSKLDHASLELIRIGDASLMLPKVRLREMSTMVRIKDGGMLVVGGLIDETNVNHDTKVPVLGNLPGLKWLFRSESKSKVKTELIIILRPQIIS